MTLAEAIAEVKRLTKEWGAWHTSHFPAAQSSFPTILNAVASGDLLPKADAELAVALVVKQAADIAEAERARRDVGYETSVVEFTMRAALGAIRDAILALAPADAMAEVQALRAELDAAYRMGMAEARSSLDRLARAEAAEAEVARLTSFLDDIQCGRGMFGLDAAVDLAWAVNHARAAITNGTP
jgi:hypothetical protein